MGTWILDENAVAQIYFQIPAAMAPSGPEATEYFNEIFRRLTEFNGAGRASNHSLALPKRATVQVGRQRA